MSCKGNVMVLYYAKPLYFLNCLHRKNDVSIKILFQFAINRHGRLGCEIDLVHILLKSRDSDYDE